jgi:2-oxoglutarate/2-oxoacid ferredoxin oxidoreductase subunit alpha
MREQKDVPSNLKELVANMVYVGILAQSIGIDLEKIKWRWNSTSKARQKPIDLNFNVVQVAAEWAKNNLEKKDPYFVEPHRRPDHDRRQHRRRAGLDLRRGAVCGLVSDYPGLEPGRSPERIPAAMRKSEDGKNTFAVIQAEDELAAIGMCVGAGFLRPARPDLHLRAGHEPDDRVRRAGLLRRSADRHLGRAAHGAQHRPAHAHLAGRPDLCPNMGHGDIDSLILLPGSINECFEFGWRAFDIAERIQTPVYVLSDLDLGMNQWMTEPFTSIPTADGPRQGAVGRRPGKTRRELGPLQGCTDGDGIPYRTLPGNTHPLSAPTSLRGTGHTPEARYSEEPDVWVANMERLKKKYETAKQYLPAPVIANRRGRKIRHHCLRLDRPGRRGARLKLERDHGLKSDTCACAAYPSPRKSATLSAHERVYVIDLNRDGQYQQLLVENTPNTPPAWSIAFNDGLPPPRAGFAPHPGKGGKLNEPTTPHGRRACAKSTAPD